MSDEIFERQEFQPLDRKYVDKDDTTDVLPDGTVIDIEGEY